MEIDGLSWSLGCPAPILNRMVRYEKNRWAVVGGGAIADNGIAGGILGFRAPGQSKEDEDRTVQANHVFVVQAADPGSNSVL